MSLKTKRIVSIVSILLTATVACKTVPEQQSGVKAFGPNETGGVDVNDLSFLFSKNRGGIFYPLVSLAKPWPETSLQNPILSKRLYDQIAAATVSQYQEFIEDNQLSGGTDPVLAELKANPNKDFEYDRWVVTAFRVDPCAPSLAMDANRKNDPNPASSKAQRDFITGLGIGITQCGIQIRLIIQPGLANGKAVDESSIHLVYIIQRGRMSDALIQDVLKLKKLSPVITTAEPLAPHPGLAREGRSNDGSGGNGSFAKEVLKFLSTHLGSFDVPANIAIMRTVKTSEGDGKPVKLDIMLGAIVDPNKNLVLIDMPVNQAVKTKIFIGRSTKMRGKSWKMLPTPENKQNLASLIRKTDLSSPGGISSDEVNAFMKFDDPESTHFFGTDCLSCHGTAQVSKEAMIPKRTDFKLSDLKQRYMSPAGITGYPLGRYLPDLPEKVGGMVVRNFGYSGDMPVIGLRTVTESASVADYFNRNLIGKKNPGYDCSKVDSEVWKLTFETKDYELGDFAQLFQNAGCKVSASETVVAGGDTGGSGSSDAHPWAKYWKVDYVDILDMIGEKKDSQKIQDIVTKYNGKLIGGGDRLVGISPHLDDFQQETRKKWNNSLSHFRGKTPSGKKLDFNVNYQDGVVCGITFYVPNDEKDSSLGFNYEGVLPLNLLRNSSREANRKFLSKPEIKRLYKILDMNLDADNSVSFYEIEGINHPGKYLMLEENSSEDDLWEMRVGGMKRRYCSGH